MRIRSSLIILAVAVLLPTVIGAALGVGYIYTEQRQAYRTSIQEMSRAMGLVLDREFARIETLLNALATSPALAQGDLETFHAQALKLAPTMDKAIILQGTTGETLMNTRRPFGTSTLPPLVSLNNVRERYGPDASIVSDVFLSPVAKEPSFAVQIPVKQHGVTVYYLTLSAFAERLQPLVKELNLPPGWFGTILDRDGVIAARTHEHERFVGQPVSAETRALMQQNEEEFFDITTLHGIKATAFVSRSWRSGWTFLVGVPREQLQQATAHATLIMGGIAGLMLALAVAGAFVFGRRISQPIEALRLATARLREGEPVAVRHSGILEIDAVNREMVRTSEEIRATRAELEHRVADAVANAERSQRALLQSQKLEALGRLTGGIAHDFNNVLQTLTAGLQIAHMSAVQPHVKHSIETCERAVERAAELVRQLMAFGRVQEAHMATVHFPQKVEEIIPMLKGGLRGDIELRLEVQDGTWPATIDPLQFELALLNLAINARDAMAGSGSLAIKIENRSFGSPLDDLPPGDYVQVSVIDSGEGMSPEVLAKARDPFFTTKEVGKGSGLGLAQAYGFARQAGGTLTIESVPGEGTAITLLLPRASRSAPAAKHGQAESKIATLRGKVLLVDDDELVLNAVKPALEAAGLEITTARNADAALARLNEHEHFDVVFSDIVMPGSMNGIGLAELIKERFPGMRVVLATGYTEQPVAVSGVRILAKPYSMNEALNALKEELSAPT
jgi:signal transduction histidine kinase